jgi:hypothetical protein
MLAERIKEWEAEWERQGWEKGRQKGWEIGRQEGEAQLLLRQLQKRFGALPLPILARVRDARSDQLERWGERLLDVSTLGELFEDEHVRS